MSKEICVIPLHTENSTIFYRHLGLHFDRCDYWRYEELEKVSISLPENFTVYDFGADRDRTADPYGDPIKVVTASEFIRIYDVNDLSVWDKACMAFLKALDPSTMCALYYH